MPAPPPDDATPTPTDDREEVVMVARGIATAVAPESGLTDVQAALLGAIAEALTGFDVDYHNLDPLSPEEFAAVLVDKPEWYRQRLVHHMVLGELVLKPLPHEVALRVQQYTAALGILDKFVRIAHRYAQGATGLAWIDLQRSGFTAHLEQVRRAQADGAPVVGYLHWSVSDNWEWIDGEVPRFGLVALDYETQERKVKQSGRFFADVIEAGALTPDIHANYVAGQEYPISADAGHHR